jgi:parvulin-like peptidyl-prolyl isomerase
VAGAQQSAILERIIVKVNGEILTQSQLENKADSRLLRDQNKQIENRKALSNEDVRKALIEITPALLVEEVDSLMLVQRARELNIKYSDEEFKRNIENIKKQNPDTIKTEADLVRALKEAGLTMETLRQNFETAYLKYVVSSGRSREILRSRKRKRGSTTRRIRRSS